MKLDLMLNKAKFLIGKLKNPTTAYRTSVIFLLLLILLKLIEIANNVSDATYYASDAADNAASARDEAVQARSEAEDANSNTDDIKTMLIYR